MLKSWRQRSGATKWHKRGLAAQKLQSLGKSAKTRWNASTAVAGEAYSAALNWKNNSELSLWLTDHFSNQYATVASKAMDAQYRLTHFGGGWHRLYDGGHSLAGSWNAIRTELPELSALDHLGTWAHEYWKDFITTRGMPIVVLDHADKLSEYFKHLDCVNLAQAVGGELVGISIYCNWNDPAKLVASAAASDCSSLVYANIVVPMVNLIALGRAFFLLRKSEQNDIRKLLEPALKGLSRSGASILLITVIPGGFLLHLSCGIVISVAHGYVWAKGSENKEVILEKLKECLREVRGLSSEGLRSRLPASGT